MSEIIDTIERILHLPVSIERAWDAVATPEGISAWFSDEADFEPVVGAEMKLKWDGKILPARIEKVEPHREFAFRWIAHGAKSDEVMTPLNSTLITFTFEEIDQSTQITMCESGFASLAPELHGISRPEHERGWGEELPKLEKYLALGLTQNAG